jgi:hypothetical protein
MNFERFAKVMAFQYELNMMEITMRERESDQKGTIMPHGGQKADPKNIL